MKKQHLLTFWPSQPQKGKASNKPEYLVNQNTKRCQSRGTLEFSLDKAGGEKTSRKKGIKVPFNLVSLPRFPTAAAAAAAPQGEAFAFLLGCTVQHSGVVNGIKINDNLSPLGFELPAKKKKHSGKGGGGVVHRYAEKTKTRMRIKAAAPSCHACRPSASRTKRQGEKRGAVF